MCTDPLALGLSALFKQYAIFHKKQQDKGHVCNQLWRSILVMNSNCALKLYNHVGVKINMVFRLSWSMKSPWSHYYITIINCHPNSIWLCVGMNLPWNSALLCCVWHWLAHLIWSPRSNFVEMCLFIPMFLILWQLLTSHVLYNSFRDSIAEFIEYFKVNRFPGRALKNETFSSYFVVNPHPLLPIHHCVHRVPMPWSPTPSSVEQTRASALILRTAIWLLRRSWTASVAPNTPFWCGRTTGNSRQTWGWTSPSATSMTTRPSSPEPPTHLTSLKILLQVICHPVQLRISDHLSCTPETEAWVTESQNHSQFIVISVLGCVSQTTKYWS